MVRRQHPQHEDRHLYARCTDQQSGEIFRYFYDFIVACIQAPADAQGVATVWDCTRVLSISMTDRQTSRELDLVISPDLYSIRSSEIFEVFNSRKYPFKFAHASGCWLSSSPALQISHRTDHTTGTLFQDILHSLYFTFCHGQEFSAAGYLSTLSALPSSLHAGPRNRPWTVDETVAFESRIVLMTRAKRRHCEFKRCYAVANHNVRNMLGGVLLET